MFLSLSFRGMGTLAGEISLSQCWLWSGLKWKNWLSWEHFFSLVKRSLWLPGEQKLSFQSRLVCQRAWCRGKEVEIIVVVFLVKNVRKHLPDICILLKSQNNLMPPILFLPPYYFTADETLRWMYLPAKICSIFVIKNLSKWEGKNAYTDCNTELTPNH